MSIADKGKTLEEIFSLPKFSKESDAEFLGLQGETPIVSEVEPTPLELIPSEKPDQIQNVDYAAMQEEIIEKLDESKSIEKAVMHVQVSLEHMKTLVDLSHGACRTGESFNRTQEGFKEVVKKTWDVIKVALERLAKSIREFFIVLGNHIRSDGIDKKIVAIQGQAFEPAKIDGQITLVDPKVIGMIIDTFKRKYEPNSVKPKAFILNLFKSGKKGGSNSPIEMKAQIEAASKVPVSYKGNLAHYKTIANTSNLKYLQTGMKETLDTTEQVHKSWLAYYKLVEEAQKTGEFQNQDDSIKEETQATIAAIRNDLAELSAMNWMGIRGFSWFITIVNTLYKSISTGGAATINMNMSHDFSNAFDKRNQNV
jgi:hypothetical protein